MKNAKLLNNVNYFYKLSQSLVAEKSPEQPMGRVWDTKAEKSAREIFKSWQQVLDPTGGKNKNIEEVYVAQKIFSSRGPGALVPVCLVKQVEAKPPENFLEYEPALAFSFGLFDENPYDTTASQISYIQDILLPKHATKYSKSDYYVASIEAINTSETVTDNPNYQDNYYIAVFAKK
jgi:hypothetical protein